MKRLIAPVLIALLLVSPVAAQSTVPCPVNRVCVEYTNASGSTDTFALSPAEGFYQEIVVEEWTTTIRDLDGERTAPDRVKVAGFLSDGDTYKLVRNEVVPAKDIYANAQLRDTFGLTELK